MGITENAIYAGALGFVDLSQLSIGEVKTVPTNSHGYLQLTDGFKIGDSNVYNIYVSNYQLIRSLASYTLSILCFYVPVPLICFHY